MDSRAWEACWSELRRRRILAALALAAFVPVWVIAGPFGLLAGFLAVFASYWRLRQWPCPRCQLPVVGVALGSFPERCKACGLPLFGHPDDVAAPSDAAPGALRVSIRLRRFVAGAEIVGGAAVMLLVAFFPRLPFWYVVTTEGLGGLSVAAGVWLWQGRQRGYVLSRAILLMQLIRLESAWLVYTATAGFYIDLYHTARGVGVNQGFYASLGLEIGGGHPFGVAVNLWAAALLLVLMHAQPELSDADAEIRPAAPSRVASPAG